MPKAKSFATASAAMQFVNPSPSKEDTETVTPPAETRVSESIVTPENTVTFEIAKDTSEKKTKRVQLLMKPTVWRAAKRAAKLAGVSLNEYIGQILEQALQMKGDKK